jgi:hypothetical protein
MLFLVLFVERDRGCVYLPPCVCRPWTTQRSGAAGPLRSQGFTGNGGAISSDVFVCQKLDAWGALTHGAASQFAASFPFAFLSAFASLPHASRGKGKAIPLTDCGGP